ncbi:MAG: hypothetical protein RLZZ15_424, partial [Verrucomicrobiota bacterium]
RWLQGLTCHAPPCTAEANWPENNARLACQHLTRFHRNPVGSGDPALFWWRDGVDSLRDAGAPPGPACRRSDERPPADGLRCRRPAVRKVATGRRVSRRRQWAPGRTAIRTLRRAARQLRLATMVAAGVTAHRRDLNGAPSAAGFSFLRAFPRVRPSAGAPATAKAALVQRIRLPATLWSRRIARRPLPAKAAPGSGE